MKPAREKSPAIEPETVASATEQTGLIPVLPEDEDEAITYEALYPVHRQKKAVGQSSK